MEDIIENKARFFAMYWGREFIYSNDFGRYKGVVGDFHFNDNIKQKAVISLKALSSITDEDAYGTGILINCWSNKERGMEFFQSDEMKPIHISGGTNFAHCIGKEYGPYLSHPFANSTTDILAAYDFLRSKGYALPFMGVSVEELVERGWIKLK